MNLGTHSALVHDASSRVWLSFVRPAEVIAAYSLAEVLPALRRIERLTQEEGWHAAGLISYEAAPAFDEALTAHPPDGFPLLWFGVYPEPERQDPGLAPSASPPLQWAMSVSREQYTRAIERIRDYIAEGDTYQVNYTARLRARFDGDPWPLFAAMLGAQECDYGAYVDIGRWVVCSASPELLLRLDGSKVTSRPMKGTAPRGVTTPRDAANAAWLRASEKNRAENLMIVDMVRNDLGRVARVGAVAVPRLFEVERYPTVWQMTSTVTAYTDAGIADIIAALFPPASVTGAPKPRTMEIIRELEPAPRHIYTGAIGFVAPGRVAQFSVAIRTAVLDRHRRECEYGVGGGIVWDSDPESEYAECQTKALVLSAARPEFDLLETILWTPDRGLFLLDYHLRRLRDSASYFGLEYDGQLVLRALGDATDRAPAAPAVLRLLLGRRAGVRCELLPGPAARRTPVRVALAPSPVDPSDVFLYHKTTNRRVYDEARAAYPEADDVLLWNTDGLVTETTIANLVYELDGALYTPPVECGLLGGTFRAWMLDRGIVCERPIALHGLSQCTRLFLVNSVRKWQEAAIVAY